MFKEKDIWLVDLGSTHLKLMNLRWHKTPRIEVVTTVNYYRTGLVNRPEDLSQLILTQILKDLVRSLKISGKPVRALLSSPGALVRIVDIPLIPASDLKATIEFNLTGLLPYAPEKAEFDFSVWDTQRNNHNQTVIVGVTPQAEVIWFTEILKRAGLEPLLLTVDTLAIYNALQFCLTDFELPLLLIHIGARRTALICLQAEQPPFFHTVDLGAESITQLLAKFLSTSYVNAELIKLGELPFPETNVDNQDTYYKALNQAFIKPLLPIILDILNHQQLTKPTKKINQIILTGGGAVTQDLDYLLARALNKTVKCWNPLENLPEKLFRRRPDLHLGWQLVPLIGLACQEGLCA